MWGELEAVQIEPPTASTPKAATRAPSPKPPSPIPPPDSVDLLATKPAAIQSDPAFTPLEMLPSETPIVPAPAEPAVEPAAAVEEEDSFGWGRTNEDRHRVAQGPVASEDCRQAVQGLREEEEEDTGSEGEEERNTHEDRQDIGSRNGMQPWAVLSAPVLMKFAESSCDAHVLFEDLRRRVLMKSAVSAEPPTLLRDQPKLLSACAMLVAEVGNKSLDLVTRW
jgi:hypothetical protein